MHFWEWERFSHIRESDGAGTPHVVGPPAPGETTVIVAFPSSVRAVVVTPPVVTKGAKRAYTKKKPAGKRPTGTKTLADVVGDASEYDEDFRPELEAEVNVYQSDTVQMSSTWRRFSLRPHFGCVLRPARFSIRVQLEIHVPHPGVRLRPVANESYRFQKIFSEKEFCAAGIVLIPPGGEKSVKNARGNAMVSVIDQFHS